MRPNSEIIRGISQFGRAKCFLKNSNSKLSAKFSSTLILKIVKNSEKCKSLSVLSKRFLRKNANRDMATFAVSHKTGSE